METKDNYVETPILLHKLQILHNLCNIVVACSVTVLIITGNY